MKLLGCDVSRGRESDCAFAVIDFNPDTEIRRLDRMMTDRLTDLPSIVRRIRELEDANSFDGIAIDASGFGAGGYDYLMEEAFRNKVFAFVAGSKPTTDFEHIKGHEKERDKCDGCMTDRNYFNLKTRVVWEMRTDAQTDRFKIDSRIEHLDRLLDELQSYQLKKISGRRKVEDPKRSPDLGDATICAYWLTLDTMPAFWLGG